LSYNKGFWLIGKVHWSKEMKT